MKFTKHPNSLKKVGLLCYCPIMHRYAPIAWDIVIAHCTVHMCLCVKPRAPKRGRCTADIFACLFSGFKAELTRHVLTEGEDTVYMYGQIGPRPGYIKALHVGMPQYRRTSNDLPSSLNKCLVTGRLLQPLQ